MKIIWIRHGKTPGNLKKRYIGTTDESLSSIGVAELQQRCYPSVDVIFTSPMRRCIETANWIYPGQAFQCCPDLRECDFGDFEGKNYTELSENPLYQQWIDSLGTLPFPNGEDPAAFKERCIQAFQEAIQPYAPSSNVSLAFVVHGGTIMAILEKLAVPKRTFYEYKIANACGLITAFDGQQINIIGEIK